MKYRLQDKLHIFIIKHFFYFILWYIGALTCLYFLHSYQSEIPGIAKKLGEMAESNTMGEIEYSKFFFLAVAILVFRTGSRLLFFLPARYQQRNLRFELIQMLEVAHPKRYKDLNDGQIYQTIFNDLNRLRGFLGFGLLQVGNIIIAFIVMIPKIVAFEPKLLIAFSPLIVSIILFSVISILFQPYAKKSMDAQGEVQNVIIESYEGKNSIKNYGKEKVFIKKFFNISGIELKYFFISTIGPTLSIPMIRLSSGISLLWGAYLVKTLDLGSSSLIFFSGFLFLIIEPLAFLAWIGVVFISAYSAWKRIKELVNVTNTISPDEMEILRLNSDETLRVPFWGKHLTLEFTPTKWTVIVGETGCGKSHVLKALAEISHLKGRRGAMVFQEPFLYNDTIAENIFLGKKITEEENIEVHKLIEIFGLDVLAESTQAVLNLEVGENGKKVSGGQAKRISLIRSLVSHSEILYWDDPFSSVDLILEKEIITSLKAMTLFKDKTLILTSHRLSTVRNSDDIYLIDKNIGIVEHGSVMHLLEKEGKVHEYFEKQKL
jgi:ATP-binding cassette subfamily B multidrug efflux pump